MGDFDQPTSAIYDDEQEPKRRPGHNRFGDLGDRLARTFGGFDRTRAEMPGWEDEGEFEYPGQGETQPVWGPGPSALQQRIDELEAELERMRQGDDDDPVAIEIKRIGEQTSAILITAHEQAQEIRREAQEQADRCLQDAASNAVQMTTEAKRRLSDLDAETDAVWHERARLLEDARTVASALNALVEQAAERFPSEQAKPIPPRPAIAARAPERDEPDESVPED
jgi:hypothetical protein